MVECFSPTDIEYRVSPRGLEGRHCSQVGDRACEANSCRCVKLIRAAVAVGWIMDVRRLRDLSYRYRSERHTRCAAMKEMVKLALQRAGLPSGLETPNGRD